MRLRNGPHGYGAVTVVLHWLTVVLLVGQFAVGWAMGPDEAATERAETALEVREEDAESRGDAAEERFEEEQERTEERLEAAEDEYVDDALGTVLSGRVLEDGVTLPEWHVLLGLALLVLALVRIAWRLTTPLPPWASGLSGAERRLATWTERGLLTTLVLAPASGLLLVAGHGDDLLAVHVGAQIGLLGCLTLHVGLVLKHQLVDRDRLLRRMTGVTTKT